MRGRVIGFGLFAAICIALTVYIGADIARIQTGGTYHLSATFGDVTGLGSGDPVKLAGVQVGQVTSVKLVKGRAAVGMSIKSSIHVPADTSIAVHWRNLIGQRYLSLVPGTSKTLMAAGTHVSNTSSVVDLSALVNQLGPLVGAISPAQLNDIFTALDQALAGNETNADTLVADLNGLLGTLAQRNATISQLLTDYKTITDAVATRDTQIGTMVDNLAVLSQAFADNTTLVDNSLQQLSGLTSGLDNLLTTSGSQLHTVVDNLSTLTGVLHDRIGSLADALKKLPPALQVLFSATAKGKFLYTNLVCASITPTCQYPIVLANPSVPVSLSSASAFRNLVLGGS